MITSTGHTKFFFSDSHEMGVLLPKLPVLPEARVPQMLNGYADWLPKLDRSHAFRLDLRSK